MLRTVVWDRRDGGQNQCAGARGSSSSGGVIAAGSSVVSFEVSCGDTGVAVPVSNLEKGLQLAVPLGAASIARALADSPTQLARCPANGGPANLTVRCTTRLPGQAAPHVCG